MKIITSAQNPLIKELKNLQSAHRRKKNKTNIVMIEGKRAILACLSSEHLKLRYILSTPEHITWVDEQGIPEEQIVQTTKELLKQISAAATPSGIFAIFEPKPQLHVQFSKHLVLAEIQDPGNMGTLIRTATAFGAQCIVIGGVSPYHPKVVQSTAGILAHASIREMTWDEFLHVTSNEQIHVIALVPQNGTPITQIPTTKSFALIVGNEGNGIPQNWLEQCACKATIPMQNNVESLNAAIAGSIALYELTK